MDLSSRDSVIVVATFCCVNSFVILLVHVFPPPETVFNHKEPGSLIYITSVKTFQSGVSVILDILTIIGVWDNPKRALLIFITWSVTTSPANLGTDMVYNYYTSRNADMLIINAVIRVSIEAAKFYVLYRFACLYKHLDAKNRPIVGKGTTENVSSTGTSVPVTLGGDFPEPPTGSAYFRRRTPYGASRRASIMMTGGSISGDAPTADPLLYGQASGAGPEPAIRAQEGKGASVGSVGLQGFEPGETPLPERKPGRRLSILVPGQIKLESPLLPSVPEQALLSDQESPSPQSRARSILRKQESSSPRHEQQKVEAATPVSAPTIAVSHEGTATSGAEATVVSAETTRRRRSKKRERSTASPGQPLPGEPSPAESGGTPGSNSASLKGTKKRRSKKQKASTGSPTPSLQDESSSLPGGGGSPGSNTESLTASTSGLNSSSHRSKHTSRRKHAGRDKKPPKKRPPKSSGKRTPDDVEKEQ